MEWKRKGLEGLICGDYRIGRFHVEGKRHYGLWHDHDFLGFFPTSEKAIAHVESHADSENLGRNA